jgi:hypothetical protein
MSDILGGKRYIQTVYIKISHHQHLEEGLPDLPVSGDLIDWYL